MVRVRYNGPSNDLYFIDGQIYELVEIHKIGGDTYYTVIDEVEDPSLVAVDGFTVVEGSENDLDWYGVDENGESVLIREADSQT